MKPENGLTQPATGSPSDLHVCPTRIDRAPVLFAHKVTAPQCSERQRGKYHKCFTCAWNHVWVTLHGKPAVGTGIERRAFDRAG